MCLYILYPHVITVFMNQLNNTCLLAFIAPHIRNCPRQLDLVLVLGTGRVLGTVRVLGTEQVIIHLYIIARVRAKNRHRIFTIHDLNYLNIFTTIADASGPLGFSQNLDLEGYIIVADDLRHCNSLITMAHPL